MKCFLLQRKHFRLLVLLFWSLLLSVSTMAQNKISGKIFEKKTNTPLAGAAIVEKGAVGGTTTGDDGSFTIVLRTSNPVLKISMVGYKPQEIPVSGKAAIEVTLEEDSRGMEDVVVIGYQNVVRRKTTAAIATVKGKDIENTPYPTFDAMLQGRVAGLNVLAVSAEPGATGIVNIRGNSSVANSNGTGVGTGISAPLYVIDGVVFDVSDLRTAYGNSNPLAVINPNDIESIDVLKDASAAAIYGARAANGVIIVKTKRPKGGRPQFRLSSYVGLTTKPAFKKVTVGAEERRMKIEFLRDLGNWDMIRVMEPMLTDSLNPAFNNATDFQSLFFQDGLIKNVDFNVGGMGDNMSYRVSVNRYEETGIQPGYGIKRTSPRLFASFNPAKTVEITADIYMGFLKEQRGDGNSNNPTPFAIQNFPSSFYRIDDATRDAYLGKNDKVRDDNRTSSFNGNARLVWKILPEITFTSSFSYNFGFVRRDYLRDRSVVANNRSDAFLTESNSRRWELENYATWDKDFGRDKEHGVTVLIGQGAEEQVINSTTASALGVPFDAIRIISSVPNGPNLTVSTNFEERSRVSYFARASYEYKGRYGIDGSFRRDASSRYAPSSRWGTFPAVSVRWNISEEPFFEPLRDIISFLKFRASYGITGRDPGSYYAQYRQLTTNQNYPTSQLAGNGNVITYNGLTAVNPAYSGAAPATNISWEQSPQRNYGIDMSLLRDRINLTVDFYDKASKNLIFNIPVPITTGYTTATNNFVDLVNQGVEFALTTNNLSNASKLKWQTTVNVAFNKNFVTKLPDGNRDFVYGAIFNQRILTVGQPVYSFRVFDISGVYPTTADVPVDPLTGRRLIIYGGGPGFVAGDNAKRDLNGDYNVDDNDMITMGNPNTKVYGGIINTLSYKGFTLQILTSFIAGRNVWNGYMADKFLGANNNVNNWGRVAGPAADFDGLSLWRKPGDIAEFGKLIGSPNDPWTIRSSFFVEDASFFRIKTVNLSYTLPPTSFTKRYHVTQIRFYGVADNLAVFYKANLPDPEAINVDGSTTATGYPTPKKFTIGLDIQF